MRAAWRATSVEVLQETRLRVRFVDGTSGEVHMQAFLQAPGTAGTPCSSRSGILDSWRKRPLSRARCGGPTAPTWRLARCTMPFVNAASGRWSKRRIRSARAGSGGASGREAGVQYDREADILHITSRPPYAEQGSEELGDDVIARLNPTTGDVESLEVLFFSTRLLCGDVFELPVTADLHRAG